MSIAEVLNHIILQEVLYSPHGTRRKTIAWHVKRQLNERVKATEAGIKDLFFLTAFLDVATADEAIQCFRQQNPDLKKILVQIVLTHNNDITDLILAYSGNNAAANYATFLTKNNQLLVRLLECNAFRNLYDTVPGRFWLKGLMVLFAVIDRIYKNCNQTNIQQLLLANREQVVGNLEGENKIKDVGDKLSRWAITNVDGSCFVIDEQIAKTLRRIGVNNIRLVSRNAEQVWLNLFGAFNDDNWANFSQKAFKNLFCKVYSFYKTDYKYLKFIVTQAFWFYGRDRCLLLDTPPTLNQ